LPWLLFCTPARDCLGLTKVQRAFRYDNDTLASGSTVGTLQYDGLGRRNVKKVENSGDWDGTYRYTYDGQKLAETRDDSDDVHKSRFIGRAHSIFEFPGVKYGVPGIPRSYCDLIEQTATQLGLGGKGYGTGKHKNAYCNCCSEKEGEKGAIEELGVAGFEIENINVDGQLVPIGIVRKKK